MVSAVSLATLLSSVTHNPFLTIPLRWKRPLTLTPLGYPTASLGSMKKWIDLVFKPSIHVELIFVWWESGFSMIDMEPRTGFEQGSNRIRFTFSKLLQLPLNTLGVCFPLLFHWWWWRKAICHPSKAWRWFISHTHPFISGSTIQSHLSSVMRGELC